MASALDMTELSDALKDDLATALQNGNAAYKKQDWEAAIEAYSAALALDSSSPAAAKTWANLAATRINNQQYDLGAALAPYAFACLQADLVSSACLRRTSLLAFSHALLRFHLPCPNSHHGRPQSRRNATFLLERLLATSRGLHGPSRVLSSSHRLCVFSRRRYALHRVAPSY